MRYLVCRIKESTYHPSAVFGTMKDAAEYTSMKYTEPLAVIDLKKGIRTNMYKYSLKELMQDGISRDEAKALLILRKKEEEKVRKIAEKYRKKFAVEKS